MYSNVLPGPAPVDVELFDPVLGRACPGGQLHADEPLAAPLAGPDPHGDLLEPLQLGILDLDHPAQCPDDRRGEVAAGEFLGALEQRKVTVRHVDRLVRHHRIVASTAVYVYVYV